MPHIKQVVDDGIRSLEPQETKSKSGPHFWPKHDEAKKGFAALGPEIGLLQTKQVEAKLLIFVENDIAPIFIFNTDDDIS